MKDLTLQVHARAHYPLARAGVRCAAQYVATPTMSKLNFREENFRDQKSNHEIHENIVYYTLLCIILYDGP